MPAPLDIMNRSNTTVGHHDTNSCKDPKLSERIKPPSDSLEVLANVPKDELQAMAKYREAVDRGRIAQWMVALFFSGYGILMTILLLAGSRFEGFYLESWVLAVLIVSMTSSVMYTLRRVLVSFFPTSG